MRNAAIFVVAALCAGHIAQARVWTNTEGQTLEAELVKVERGQVYLKLAKDRKVRPLKIETLSEADRKFIKQYEQDQVAQRKANELAKRKAKWLTDYDDVKAEAEKLDLPILLLFTAPEWCGYCIMLEQNVLDKEEFKEYAKANLVLYLADFSNSSDAEDWREEYPKLAKEFPFDGYPCAYLISPSGKQLGRIGGCDSEWSPRDYIDMLESYRKK
jgi:thiol-disulfide isomerase/thioredoxin